MILRERVAAGPVLADGGWGTELQKRGLADGPEQFTSYIPALIHAGARAMAGLCG